MKLWESDIYARLGIKRNRCLVSYYDILLNRQLRLNVYNIKHGISEKKKHEVFKFGRPKKSNESDLEY